MSHIGISPLGPMTIANARENGLSGIEVYCRKCHHAATMRFEALDLPDETPIPEIGRIKRFVCSSCGGWGVKTMPDWTDYKASGRGGMGRCC